MAIRLVILPVFLRNCQLKLLEKFAYFSFLFLMSLVSSFWAYPFVWNFNILAKCCGSFKKFNTYFLQSLVSSLFFYKLDFLQGCPVYTFQHLRHSFFWKPKISRLIPSYLWFWNVFVLTILLPTLNKNVIPFCWPVHCFFFCAFATLQSINLISTFCTQLQLFFNFACISFS